MLLALYIRWEVWMYFVWLFKAKVVLWLVGYKKEMVDVDLKMFRFVMLNVPCQQNEWVFTLQSVIRFKLIARQFMYIILAMSCVINNYLLLCVSNDCGVFIMKFMDNWSNGGLSKSIDVVCLYTILIYHHYIKVAYHGQNI